MNKVILGRVLWASSFLQAAWNYNGQQNLGLAAALRPVVEELHGRASPAARGTLERALKPFNTHPYLSGPLLGILINLEALGPDGGFPPERVERYKKALMTAFAALGDAFFWNALLPAAAVLGMFWAVRTRSVGVAVFLILFNLIHLSLRIGGFWMGYRRGLALTSLLDRLALPRQALRLRLFTAGALGVLAAGTLFARAPVNWSDAVILGLGVAAGPMIWLLAELLKYHLSVETLIYGLLVLLLIVTHIWG